jgi:Rha family phage regulatory protein
MKKRPTPHEKPSALEPRRHSTAATPLVELDHGEVWTTSLLIAEKFGKQHKNVIQAIGNLECSMEFAGLNFQLSEYTDSTGRRQPMYRITRDGFAFLAMGFTGREAAAWKEKFISAFGKMERELRRIATQHASPDWIEARHSGKQDRRDLTDAVQALCERAQERGDSTTPLHLWMTAATRTVTATLFETAGERIKAIRGRLTARQLRRLAMGEEVFARALDSLIDTTAHHKAISEQGKVAVLAFAAATGGREVPGVDRGARRLTRNGGFIAPELAAWLVVLAAFGAMLAGWL